MARSVADKLGVKAGSRVFLSDAPVEFVDMFKAKGIEPAPEPEGLFDYIHCFNKSREELENSFIAYKSRLKPGGALWISWPKKGQMGTDLSLHSIIGTGYDHGLVESLVVSIDEVWSAIKFTHPKPGKEYGNRYGTLAEE